jgi:hypothetical protein
MYLNYSRHISNTSVHQKTLWVFVKLVSTIFLVLQLSISIIQCGLDIEDPTPPSRPHWVQKSLPGEWPEKGIDAHESGGIFLEWKSSLDDDIIAYIIYRATMYPGSDSLGNYELLIRLETESNAEGVYIDEQVVLRTRYFYKIKSVDLANNISVFSDSINFSIIPWSSLSSMNPNGLDDPLGPEMSLNWYYLNRIEMEDYCLTILDQNNDLVLREQFLPGNYASGGMESWFIPNNIILEPGVIYKWRLDTGARYVLGRETSGSESQWAIFLFIGG